MNRRFCILNLVTLALCLVFSLLQFTTIMDLSFSAVWLALVFTGFLIYFSFYKLQLKKDEKSHKVAFKLYEYIPFVFLTVFVLRRAGTFGTGFVYDLICVLLWLATAVLSLITKSYISEKNFYKKNTEFKPSNKDEKLPVGKKVFFEVLDWVDAFVQAVFTIILLNIFIFQLYEIPSESMVSEYLVGDRVLVFKTLSGPKFPMSNVGLPDIKNYERGDVVVFRNPHYPATRQRELQNFTSQLVFMLTLTGVNLNVDENGAPIADPLVKRVCGVEGEQLVMLDGVLYHRTKDNLEFTPVEEESRWAEWNLNDLSPALKSRVQVIPFSNAVYQKLLDIEKYRGEFNISDFANNCRTLSEKYNKLYNSWNGYYQNSKGDNSGNIKAAQTLFSPNEMTILNLFQNNEKITKKILTSPEGKAWFEGFVSGWLDDVPEDVLNGKELYGGDMYSDSLFRINLMVKNTLGHLIIRNTELIASKTPISLWQNDYVRTKCLDRGELLNLYITLNDSRNMMVFPPNKGDEADFIPKKSYFMMGDNRFNSLDMRHSYEYHLETLVDSDDFSVTYQSNLAPQLVNSSRILGSPSLRFWPFDRFGLANTKK